MNFVVFRDPWIWELMLLFTRWRSTWMVRRYLQFHICCTLILWTEITIESLNKLQCNCRCRSLWCCDGRGDCQKSRNYSASSLSAEWYVYAWTDVITWFLVKVYPVDFRHTLYVWLSTACGAIPSPFDCYLVNRGLKTLHLRMREHMRNGLEVAHYLEKHPLVERVIHPGTFYTIINLASKSAYVVILKHNPERCR